MSRKEKRDRIAGRLEALAIPGWAIDAVERGVGVRLPDGREVTEEMADAYRRLQDMLRKASR